MERTKGYDEAQAVTGEYERLAPGGYVCKIIQAKEEKSQAGNDMLVIAFDIAEGDSKDFYKRKFDGDTRSEKKWQGVHRIMLLDKEGNTNKFFKGFITCVETSNKNFKWDWKEEELKGKLFGGVFGREEFEEGKFITKIRFIRSADKVKDAEIPEDKLLTKSTSVSYTVDYNNVDDDKDLPFN